MGKTVGWAIWILGLAIGLGSQPGAWAAETPGTVGGTCQHVTTPEFIGKVCSHVNGESRQGRWILDDNSGVLVGAAYASADGAGGYLLGRDGALKSSAFEGTVSRFERKYGYTFTPFALVVERRQGTEVLQGGGTFHGIAETRQETGGNKEYTVKLGLINSPGFQGTLLKRMDKTKNASGTWVTVGYEIYNGHWHVAPTMKLQGSLKGIQQANGQYVVYDHRQPVL